MQTKLNFGDYIKDEVLRGWTLFGHLYMGRKRTKTPEITNVTEKSMESYHLEFKLQKLMRNLGGNIKWMEIWILDIFSYGYLDWRFSICNWFLSTNQYQVHSLQYLKQGGVCTIFPKLFSSWYFQILLHFQMQKTQKQCSKPLLGHSSRWFG